MLKSSSSTLFVLNAFSLPPETSLCVQVMLQLLSWASQLWPKEKLCPNLVLLRRFGATAVVCLKVSCLLWLSSPGRDNSESQRPLKLCIQESPGKGNTQVFHKFHSSVMPPKTIPSFLEIPYGIREYEAFFLPASLSSSSFLLLKCLKHGERLLVCPFCKTGGSPWAGSFCACSCKLNCTLY